MSGYCVLFHKNEGFRPETELREKNIGALFPETQGDASRPKEHDLACSPRRREAHQTEETPKKLEDEWCHLHFKILRL